MLYKYLPHPNKMKEPFVIVLRQQRYRKTKIVMVYLDGVVKSREFNYRWLSALIRKFCNVFFTNCLKKIHRRGSENAEKFINFRLSLRRRQTKAIMPLAVCSQTKLARRAWVYSFSPFSEKRNKKKILRELCVSNERSAWAVRQNIIRDRI